MKRYELEAMSKDELIEHGKAMGIDISEEDKKMTMVDKILGEHVPVNETPKEAKKSSSGVTKQKDTLPPPLGAAYELTGKKIDGRKYRVKIFSTETDKSDVDLIVNGHNIRVKRNMEVVLDEAYVEVLRNATIDTVVQDADSGIRSPQTIQVYPHQAIAI